MRGVGNVGELSFSYKGHHGGVCVCVTSMLQYYYNSLITIKGKDLGQIEGGGDERGWECRAAKLKL